ncbi:g4479 [Coccomyxa viridis]|uniref:G4479 protein n=1 Tax=Coccomyxa viridis TaxID=1274662 RepID=A0ABP1FTG9_9CHLO
METYSDHSAILDYLAQVEQEEQLRESLKSKSGIAALRVEKGAGPYKSWEKQPLCDELGGASSSSADEDYYNDKEHSGGSIVSGKTLQYLVWFNAALFLLVVIGGTLMGAYSHPQSSVGSTRPEPPGSLLRHNALLNLHSNPATRRAPAPAPMSYSGSASTPHIAPAISVAAPGLGPAPALNAARDKFGAGKRAGGAAQGQAAPVASAAALAAARYWKEQQEDESEQEAGHAWEDGDLTWTGPASVQGPPPAAAWYWKNRVSGPGPRAQPHVPAPAPAHASKPSASSQEDYWARAAQYFSSAASQGMQRQTAQSTQSMEAAGSKPWQHMQGRPSSVSDPEAQPEPVERLSNPAQQSTYSGTDYDNIPSQADMAAQIYSENPTMPKQAAQGVPKPSPKAAGLSKWVPFHAVASKLPTAAHPAEARGATYLTPSEVQAIGARPRQADTADLQEEGFLDAQTKPWP